MSLPQQTTLAIATNNPDRKFSLFDPRLGFTPTTSNPIPDQEPMQRRPPISTLPLPHPSETMQLYAGDHQRLLGPVPPSSDAELLHQRLSELRTALDASNRMCNNLESQVEGLKLSLQSKHDESTRLQLDLSRALSSLELIQASWAGDLSQIQPAMMQDLHAELASRSSVMVKLQSELQSRQFEIQSLISRHESSSFSEAQERARLASELGQARVLAMAMARQLEVVFEASERLQSKLDETIASESTRYKEATDEIESLKTEMKSREVRWEREKKASVIEFRQILGEKEAAQLRAREFESETSELKTKVAKLEAVIKDQELQVEWLEGALSDLEGSEGGGGYGASRHRHQGVAAYESLVREAQAQGVEAHRLRVRVDELVEERGRLQAAIAKMSEAHQCHDLELQQQQQQAQPTVGMLGDDLEGGGKEKGEGGAEGGEEIDVHSSAGAVCVDKGVQVGTAEDLEPPPPPPSSSASSWSEALTIHDEGDNEKDTATCLSPLSKAESTLKNQPSLLPLLPAPPPVAPLSRLPPTSPAPPLAALAPPLADPKASDTANTVAVVADRELSYRYYSERMSHMKSLLDSATGEIERLSLVNQKLLASSPVLQAAATHPSTLNGELSATGEGGSKRVPLEDVKKALMEVRESCRARSEEALEACARSWASRLKESEERLETMESKLAEAQSHKALLQSRYDLAGSRIKEMEAALNSLTLERDDAVRIQISRVADLNSKVEELESKIEALMNDAMRQREAFQFEFKRVVLHAETRHQEILQSSVSNATKEATAEIERLRDEVVLLNEQLKTKTDVISALEDQLAEVTSIKDRESSEAVRAVEEQLAASMVDLNSSLDRIAVLESQISLLSSQNHDLEHQLSDFTSECSQMRSMVKKEVERANAAEASLLMQRSSFESDVQSKLEQSQDRISTLEAEMKAAIDALAKSETELKRSETEVERHLLLVGSLGCELEEKEAELRDVEEVARRKAEAEASEMAGRMEAELSNASSELRLCYEKISALESLLKKSEEEVTRSETQIETLETASQESSALVSALKADLEGSQSAVVELKRQLDQRGRQCDELESIVVNLEVKYEAQVEKLNELESRLGQSDRMLGEKDQEMEHLIKDLSQKEKELSRIKMDLDRSLKERMVLMVEKKERQTAPTRALGERTNLPLPFPRSRNTPNPSQNGSHHQAVKPPAVAATHFPSLSAQNAVKALNDLEAQLLSLDYLKSVTRGAESTTTSRAPLMDVSERNAVSRILSASRNVDLIALATSSSPEVSARMNQVGRNALRMSQGQLDPGSYYFAPHDGEGVDNDRSKGWGRMTDTVRASVGDNEVLGEKLATAPTRSARVSLADLGSLSLHR